MICFVNFARIASICVSFDLGTLHGYFSHQDFWPNLNFPLEYQIKLVLRPRSLRTDLGLNILLYEKQARLINSKYQHFNMDTLQTILKLMTKDCFMASIDIKHAYHAIPVDENFQKFLKFEFGSCLYCFTCFPNGLRPCPRKFTKTLKPPLADLRDKGHISSA